MRQSLRCFFLHQLGLPASPEAHVGGLDGGILIAGGFLLLLRGGGGSAGGLLDLALNPEWLFAEVDVAEVDVGHEIGTGEVLGPTHGEDATPEALRDDPPPVSHTKHCMNIKI